MLKTRWYWYKISSSLQQPVERGQSGAGVEIFQERGREEFWENLRLGLASQAPAGSAPAQPGVVWQSPASGGPHSLPLDRVPPQPSLPRQGGRTHQHSLRALLRSWLRQVLSFLERREEEKRKLFPRNVGSTGDFENLIVNNSTIFYKSDKYLHPTSTLFLYSKTVQELSSRLWAQWVRLPVSVSPGGRPHGQGSLQWRGVRPVAAGVPATTSGPRVRSSAGRGRRERESVVISDPGEGRGPDWWQTGPPWRAELLPSLVSLQHRHQAGTHRPSCRGPAGGDRGPAREGQQGERGGERLLRVTLAGNLPHVGPQHEGGDTQSDQEISVTFSVWGLVIKAVLGNYKDFKCLHSSLNFMFDINLVHWASREKPALICQFSDNWLFWRKFIFSILEMPLQ